jgi:hypothetical protein
MDWNQRNAEQAPDLIEPIVGWRLWLVVADGGYLWLESMLYPTRWSPRRAVEARCIPHRRCYFCNPKEAEGFPTHRAPDADCECGIYAARSPETLAPYLDSTYPGRTAVGSVLGQVRLWGTVVEGDRGWRGEYAYPDLLYASNGLTEHSLRDYGVPVLALPAVTTPEILASLRAA